MQGLTDNDLMLKVKSGDLQTFGLLYERHKKRVFGFFYNLNADASLSEDLVQNVFMRMLKYRNSYTGEGSFTAWMFRTARNVNNDHYKKNRVDRNAVDLDRMATVSADDDLEAAMDQQDNESLLHRAMQRLPQEKREILILSKYKGIKFSEIGKIMDCTESAAKVRAHRALTDLRALYLKMQTETYG